jgi:hypothetical protein
MLILSYFKGTVTYKRHDIPSNIVKMNSFDTFARLFDVGHKAIALHAK